MMSVYGVGFRQVAERYTGRDILHLRE